MERQFGFDLFVRTSRHVTLTAEGSLFLDSARRMVFETDWMNQAAPAIRSDEVRIGAAHDSGQIAERQTVIERSLQRQSDVPLRILSRTHAQLYEALAGNEIDIAITLEISPLDAHRSTLDPATGRELCRWVLGERPIRLLLPQAMADVRDDLSGRRLAD